MGSISGRKLYQVIDNLEYILAIELLSAAQAIEFRKPLKSSALLEFAHQLVRKEVSFAPEDRIFADDIQRIHQIIHQHQFVSAVHAQAASLDMELPE
jgi:histidine ammonia-lyase